MSFRLYGFIIMTLSLFGSGCTRTEPSLDNIVLAETETPALFNTAGSPTVEFSVPDMMCPDGCGVAVKEILAKQPGAKDVLVDFEGKTAKVAFEEGKFDADQALAALIDRQFTNSSLKPVPGFNPQVNDDAR